MGKWLRPAILTTALVCAAQIAQACQSDRVELRGDWGRAAFTAEVADEPRERSIGLMNRPSLPQSAGMLFIYETPRRATFWMRNTLIPLDMIFIGPDGIVRHIHSNAIPLDETTIDGGTGILAVLEINGGLSETLGIAPGTEIRHPDLPQDNAAWPCD